MAAPAGEPGPVCHKVCLEDLAAGSSGRGPTRAGRGPVLTQGMSSWSACGLAQPYLLIWNKEERDWGSECSHGTSHFIWGGKKYNS